ncbi:MAG TPA: hypothetical protein VEQ85_04250 [Lacipirellulaceae bacterium]|nr:hypothetical protein [Lacipirellulaceae bacterium]
MIERPHLAIRGVGRSARRAMALAMLSAAIALPSRAGEVSPLEIVDAAREAPAAAAAAVDEAAGAPPAAGGAPRIGGADEIFLVSTRGMGIRCDAALMPSALQCDERGPDGRWQRCSWSDLIARFERPLPTVIYVHGNRVASGADRAHGLEFYRWLHARRTDGAPLRYVIWSWPSAQIPGRLKDYEVKAARCRPCAWQLAWAVDQMPPETPLAIVGYSYGARLTSGALHLLGGGRMGDLQLAERAHPQRSAIRVALVAAAMDAHWLRPGGVHGEALGQVESLVLVSNQLDPAMRFYPLSPVGHRVPALGYSGPVSRESLGELAERIQTVDMTAAVGRRHALSEYMASGLLARALDPVVDLAAPSAAVDSSLAGRDDAARQ